jgi:FMN phosphatase YigB (HAD superfamily)
MIVNKNENRIEIDVDQTLAMHNVEDYPSITPQTIDYYGMPMMITPHHEHIRLLKSYKARGFYILVHSNNGVLHAEKVVKALGLEDFVDEVCTKACKYVDDTKEDTRQWVYLHMKKEDVW